MKISTLLLICMMLAAPVISKQQPVKEKAINYRLKIYHLKDSTEIARVSDFLKDFYLPAAHNLGQKQIGVFLEKSSEFGVNIYLFSPLSSLDELNSFDQRLMQDKKYADAFKTFNTYDGKHPFYQRVETIVLDAFPKMPFIEAPLLKAAKSARVYELRNYESPTEEMALNKVKMFNVGNEVALFKRLNFNAVFYASVISGPRMPNLMYMITFENMADHDAKWASFKDDPEWKRLSSMPEYQNNVNKIDAHFMTPMDYSDL